MRRYFGGLILLSTTMWGQAAKPGGPIQQLAGAAGNKGEVKAGKVQAGAGAPAALVQRALAGSGLPKGIEPKDVPGMRLALEKLEIPACASLVGGPYRALVETRVLTSHYFESATDATISAEEVAPGRNQAIFAVSDPDLRRVFLFPAFKKPNYVLVRLLSGGAARRDFIRDFERAHEFVQGSVTVEILQALILIHEQMHLNLTALEDSACFPATMFNTQSVARVCFPEITKAPSAPVVAKALPHAAKGCTHCHGKDKKYVVAYNSRPSK